MRLKVGIQLNFNFQLTFPFGDDNLLDEHSEAGVAYRVRCALSFAVAVVSVTIKGLLNNISLLDTLKRNRVR